MTLTPSPSVDVSGLPAHLQKTLDPLAFQRLFTFFARRIECWWWEQEGRERSTFRDTYIGNDKRVLNLWRTLDAGDIWFHELLDAKVGNDLRLAVYYVFLIHHRDTPVAWSTLGVPKPEEFSTWWLSYEQMVYSGTATCANIHQTVSFGLYRDLMIWLVDNLDVVVARVAEADTKPYPRDAICAIFKEQFGVGAYSAWQILAYLMEFGVLPGCSADNDNFWAGPGCLSGLRWVYSRAISAADARTVVLWIRENVHKELMKHESFRRTGYPTPVIAQGLDVVALEHSMCEYSRYTNARVNPRHLFRT